MLKRLRIDNFKSLINVVFEPGLVNLLVGRNNSGKTNFCQALRFLQLSSAFQLSDAVFLATGEPWNVTNAYLKKDKVTFNCTCELSDTDESLTFEYDLEFRAVQTPQVSPLAKELFVENEQLKASGGRFGAGTILLENIDGRVRLLQEGKLQHQSSEVYVETNAPTNQTMLSRLYDLQHNRAANLFKRYLSGWLYYDLEPLRLRSQDARGVGFALNADGSNLAHVLFQLKTLDERKYRRFVEIVREVEPKLDAINFIPPTQDSVFMSITDAADRRFNMASISSGTIRFMGIAYVILMTAVSAEFSIPPPPIVLIEEPENGLYVGHLRKLMELVKPTGHFDPQFVFTSHSPYFIDFFDTYLDNVFLAKADATHSEIIRSDPLKLQTVLEQFSLGEAYFRELLQ